MLTDNDKHKGATYLEFYSDKIAHSFCLASELHFGLITFFTNCLEKAI